MPISRLPLSRTLPLLVAAAVLLGLAWLLRPDAGVHWPSSGPAVAEGAQPAATAARATRALPGFLPPEAAPVIERILQRGTFPHPQDGSVFFNREGHLPARARGHYREYTVPTPGLSHRGARRIVTGGDPPGEWFYTADHYESFRAFALPAAETGP